MMFSMSLSAFSTLVVLWRERGTPSFGRTLLIRLRERVFKAGRLASVNAADGEAVWTL